MRTPLIEQREAQRLQKELNRIQAELARLMYRGSGVGGDDGGTSEDGLSDDDFSDANTNPIINTNWPGDSDKVSRSNHTHYGIRLYEATTWYTLPSDGVPASALGRIADGTWYKRNNTNTAWVVIVQVPQTIGFIEVASYSNLTSVTTYSIAKTLDTSHYYVGKAGDWHVMHPFYGAATPAGARGGDIWFKSDGKAYRYIGAAPNAAWVLDSHWG